MSYLQEEPYRTPAGAVDLPFAYVLDATGFRDATSIFDIQVTTSGDSDFILRHIAGVNTCVDTAANGGKFNYKNASGSYTQGAAIVMPKNFPVVPEKRYPLNSSIYLDLIQTLRAGTANAGSTIYNSYIGFFGVKRFTRGVFQNRVTPYRYKEKRYSYEYSLTLSQGHYTLAGGTVTTQPVRQVIQMDNFDFELLQIGISNSTGSGALLTNDFQIQLYDPDMRQLSSAPLNQGYINAARTSPSAAAPYQGLMPCPSMVWPAGGNIVFDVTSMLPNASVPATYNLSFEGVWRIPC